MFALSDIVASALGAAVVASLGLSAWGWSRKGPRLLASAASTFLGFTAWNVLQSNTGADLALNIDWPVFPLSWSDVGSGVASFVVTVVVLGLVVNRAEPAWRVVAAAGIAGLLATAVDLVVL